MSAAVTQAVADFFTGLAEDVGDPDDVATYLARGIVAGHRRLAEHTTSCSGCCATRPSRSCPSWPTVMPIVVELVRAALVERLAADELRPGVEVRARPPTCSPVSRCRSWGRPGRWDLDDPEAVHRFVTDGLLAGVLERPA